MYIDVVLHAFEAGPVSQVFDNLVWDLRFLTENWPGSRQSRLLICGIDTSWSMTFHFRRQSAILQPIKSVQSCFPNGHQLRFQVTDLYFTICMFLMCIMYSHFHIGTLHRHWGFSTGNYVPLPILSYMILCYSPRSKSGWNVSLIGISMDIPIRLKTWSAGRFW